MGNPLLAFLMASFLSSPKALQFIKQNKMMRMDTKQFNETKWNKIMDEINDFKVQARDALNKC